MPSQVQPSQRSDSQQVEVHRNPAKGGGNAVPTLVCPSPRADRALHNKPSPNAHPSPYSSQSAEKQEATAYATAAHSNTTHSHHSPGSSRPGTPATLQNMASTTDATSVDSVAMQGDPRANVYFDEQQSKCMATRAPTGRPRRTAAQRQVDFPQGLLPIL